MGEEPNKKEPEIRKLNWTQAVRRRPGMHFGGIDGRAMLTAIFYMVEYSLEYVIRSACTQLDITLRDDNAVIIKDNGPGLSPEIPPSYEKSIAELFLTAHHVGYLSWPDSLGYMLCVTNAASTECHFQTRRDGYVWEQSYQAGEPTGPLKQIRALNENEPTGNLFAFTLDPTIFEAEATISYADMMVNLREIAYLLPDLKITLRDERQNPVAAHEFHSPNGLTDFVTFLNRDCEGLHEIIHSTDEIELRLQNRDPYTITVDFAIQFTDCETPFQLSYMNLRETLDGGVHIDTLRRAVCEAVTSVAKDKHLAVPTSEDELLRGMTAVIHVQHPNPVYESTLPVHLMNPDVEVVNPAIFNAVNTFFWRAQEVLQRVLDRQSSSRALPINERRYGEIAPQVKYRHVMF